MLIDVRSPSMLPAATVDDLPLGVLVADDAGRVASVNRAWTEISGLDPEGSVVHRWLDVFEPDERATVLRQACDATASSGRPADHRIRSGTGHRWTRWWISRNPGGQLNMVVADVEDDHQLRDELQHRAFHDALTGLTNRAHLFELIERSLRGHRRDPRNLAVLYIDLDGFKSINDRHGHAVGDRVLVAVADVLRAAVRPNDVLARVGGDEFAVMCDQLDDVADAVTIADRIQEALEQPMTIGEHRWRPGAAIGISYAKPDETGAEALLDRADRAMYAVKQGRVEPPVRNCVESGRAASPPTTAPPTPGHGG